MVFKSGLDADGDLTLAEEEVQQEAVVCNGIPGVQGEPGRSCTVSRDATLGTATIECEDGTSAAVTDGQDGVDGNDGESGVNSLLTTDAEVGNACDAYGGGGIRIQSGLDNGDGEGSERNGRLEPGEIDQTTYLSHGSTGADGDDGQDGFNALVVHDDEVGTACDAYGNGGIRIRSGWDDGTEADHARNGTLDEEEIEQTVYLCNGRAGNDGEDGQDAMSTLFVLDHDVSQPRTETIAIAAKLNIDAAYGPPFDSNAPDASSNFRVDLDLFDSNRIAHPARMYFRREAATMWEWHLLVDGASQQGGIQGSDVEVASGTMSFLSSGELVDVVVTLNDFNPVGANQPQTFAFDFGDPLAQGGTGTQGTLLYTGNSTLLRAAPQSACPANGARIRTGMDNGDGGGVAHNQSLEDGEVDSTVYVCDGEAAPN